MNYFKEKLQEIILDVPKIIEHEWSLYSKYRTRILKRTSQYLLILSVVFLAGIFINDNVISPLAGGTYAEGVTEQMHFLNPVYAQNETELAISKLLYSPLIQFDSHGNAIPMLANIFNNPTKETTEYVFNLRDNIYFHDGAPITSDDVKFTFDTLKNQKNPNVPNSFLQDIDIIAVDLKTVKFILKEPYAGMQKRLSEVGIIPKHIWDLTYEEALISPLQTEGPGSGPYQFYKGNDNAITLKRFKGFEPNTGFLSYIVFIKFNSKEDALAALGEKSIDGFFIQNFRESIKLPEFIKQYPMILPRQFILFLNPKSNYFNDKQTRLKFLNNINSKTIPLPAGTFKKQSFSILESLNTEKTTRTLPEIPQKPTIYKKTLTLYYLNTPALKTIADQIVTHFNNKKLAINAIPLDELSYADVIVKQKAFDIFLGGQEFMYDSDLYAYWYSTEREFPGLNISGYGKKDSDILLDQIKKEPSITRKLDLFSQYDRILTEDAVALPLFSPIAVYAVHKKFSPFIDSHTLLWNKRTSWMFLWFTKSLSLFSD